MTEISSAMGALRFVVGLLRFAHDLCYRDYRNEPVSYFYKTGARARSTGAGEELHSSRHQDRRVRDPDADRPLPQSQRLWNCACSERSNGSERGVSHSSRAFRSAPGRHRSRRLIGPHPFAQTPHTRPRTGELMSSLDVHLLSVSLKRSSILRPILTLSVVLALIFVALATGI